MEKHKVGRLISVVSLAAGLSGGLASPAQARLECFGRTPTIVGTPGADELVGTPGRDVIVGLGGDDTIDGKKWGDFVCGDAGNDRVVSHYGNDHAAGGTGADTVSSKYRAYGGAGSDVVDGLIAHGGRGADRVYGDFDSNHLYGDEGNDVVFDDDGVEGSENWYRGSLYEDWLYGGAGDDRLHSSNFSGWGADDPSDHPDHVFGGSHLQADSCVVDDEDLRRGCERVTEFENP